MRNLYLFFFLHLFCVNIVGMSTNHPQANYGAILKVVLHKNNCADVLESWLQNAQEFYFRHGLDFSAMINGPVYNKGRTLLHHAVRSGKADCVNVLLSFGASVLVKDAWMSRPFDCFFSQSVQNVITQQGVAIPTPVVGRGSKNSRRNLLRRGAKNSAIKKK